MSSSVDLNSILTALGAKSGFDVPSIVNNLIYAARAQERQWQNQQADIETQKQYLTYYNTLASNLSNTLNQLKDPIGPLTAMATTSSQNSIVTASAAAGTVAGSHIIKVQNLASTAAWYSDRSANATTPLAAGSFSLQVGAGDAVNIEVGGASGVDNLEELAAYINGEDLGVSASIVNDALGSRLAIVSKTSGADGDIAIVPNGVNFAMAAEGKNALVYVDGIPVSSATNTVTGAVNGLTLNLQGAAPETEVTVTVKTDTEAAKNAVNNFVSAYNSLVKDVNSQFKYNESLKASGPMAGSSVLRMFQSDLLSMASYSSGDLTSQVSNLAGMGITMGNDGTLTADSTKLDAALKNNYSAVQVFFQGTDSNGFAHTLNTRLDTYTDSTEGAFTIDLKTIGDQYKSLQKEIDDFEVYIASEQERLTEYYNNVNVQLQKMTSQVDQIKALLDPGDDD